MIWICNKHLSRAKYGFNYFKIKQIHICKHAFWSFWELNFQSSNGFELNIPIGGLEDTICIHIAQRTTSLRAINPYS